MAKASDKLKSLLNVQPRDVKQFDPATVVPKTAPGIMMMDHQKLKVAEAKLAEIEQKLSEVQKGVVLISDLHEVEGRKRTLSKDDYEQLKANLSQNPLVNPIVVKTREEGGYEIISGHNRVQAYRDLGRTEIAALIREFANGEVFEAAFYSNLISSPLTDFEKYQGFKRIQEATKETQKELAERAGVAESAISILMAFSKLPSSVLEAIKQKPDVLGATSVSKFEKIAKDRPAEVVAAINKLANGVFKTEKEAVDSLIHVPPKTQPQRIEIKSGKKTYAKVTTRQNIISVELKDVSKQEQLQAEIVNLIKKYSEG